MSEKDFTVNENLWHLNERDILAVAALVHNKTPLLHTKELWAEFRTFDRLLYKFHHQQRSCVHFRRCKLLRRRLQRVAALEKWAVWAVVSKNSNDMDLIKCNLQLSIDMAQSARQDCMKAYSALVALLKDFIYVPFGIVTASAVAKIYCELGKLKNIFSAHLSSIVNPIIPTRKRWNSDDEEVMVDGKLALEKPIEKSISVDKSASKFRHNLNKVESGWELSVSSKKKLKFQRKIKQNTNSKDEIDQIFDL